MRTIISRPSCAAPGTATVVDFAKLNEQNERAVQALRNIASCQVCKVGCMCDTCCWGPTSCHGGCKGTGWDPDGRAVIDAISRAASKLDPIMCAGRKLKREIDAETAPEPAL